MKYTDEQKLQIERLNETNKKCKRIYISILKGSIAKAENMNDYHDLEDITTEMIEELREKSFFSLISGEKYEVIRLVKELIEYNEEFKDYPISSDRMTWILRRFHDTFYDFDGYENGIKRAMKDTLENYEL